MPPTLDDHDLTPLLQRIEPVVDVDGRLHAIEPVDPRRTAFTWSPQPTDAVDGLVELARITTLHGFGAAVFFKPTIAEVIAQIPAHLRDDVCAFQTLTDDVAVVPGEPSRHAATTILYVRGPTQDPG